MKSFLFRWLVVLLTCISVPVQGYAAVATCGPVHHGDADAVRAAELGHGHASHADTNAAHQHELSVADRTGSANVTQCGTCAACCAGSLMAPPAFHSMATIGRFEIIPFLPLAVSSAIPETIDRPPLPLSL